MASTTERKRVRMTPPLTYGIPSPCHNCKKRHPACHDSCSEFAQYRKRLQAIKDAQYADDVAHNIRVTAPHLHNWYGKK